MDAIIVGDGYQTHADLLRAVTTEVVDDTIANGKTLSLAAVENRQREWATQVEASCHAVDPTQHVPTFVTQAVMFQSGYHCICGIDSYNGTYAVMGYDTYRAATANMTDQPKLKDIKLKVKHVAGGMLTLHGLWQDALLMINGQPCTVHIVVASISVGSSDILLGIPALVEKGCVACFSSLLAYWIDDDGDRPATSSSSCAA